MICLLLFLIFAMLFINNVFLVGRATISIIVTVLTFAIYSIVKWIRAEKKVGNYALLFPERQEKRNRNNNNN